MAYCKHCGSFIEDGVKFCPACGKPVEGTSSEPQPSQTASAAAQDSAAQDAEKNKGMGILAYLGILVLIPIYAAKESKFARYHSNQGLTLCIAWIGWCIIDSVLSALLRSLLWNTGAWRMYAFISTILNLVYIVFTVLAVIGIINVVNGRMKELPLIGKFKLLK